MMIFCTVLVIILYANLVSTDIDDLTEQLEKVAYSNSYHEPDEYPFFVSLQEKYPPSTTGYRHFCGGSLIGRQIVVTAGHCVEDEDEIDEIRILPNYRNSPFIAEWDLTFKISRYVIHPGYMATNNVSKNDIAVILMDQPDPRHRATIRLPITETVPLCEPVTLIGFGLIETGVLPDELRSAVLFRLTDEMCNHYNFPGDFTPVLDLCTANAIGSGVCNGDSGGPLIRKLGNNSYLQGVATNSADECGIDPITNFVNVPQYLTFINAAMVLLTRDELKSNQNEYVQHSMDSNDSNMTNEMAELNSFIVSLEH